MGVSLSVFVVALFNQAVWREQSLDAPIYRVSEVLRLWLLALGLIGLVLWQAPFLYGPIALGSVVGILMLLGMVNGLLVLLARGRHNRMSHWREIAPYLGIGLLLCVLEIAGIDVARSALTRSLGLPF